MNLVCGFCAVEWWECSNCCRERAGKGEGRWGVGWRKVKKGRGGGGGGRFFFNVFLPVEFCGRIGV